MTTATAAKKARLALTDEYVALALAKLGLDMNAGTADEVKDNLKAISKKSEADITLAVSRLRGMRDFNAAPAAPEAATWAPAPERASNGGNGGRRPAAPKVSQAKLDYVASLLRELWASDTDTAEELVAELPTFNAAHIDQMIDNIKPILPITDGQARFMRNLVEQKLAPGSDLAVAILDKMDSLTKIEAKRHLDDLQKLPNYVAPAAAGEAPARRNTPEVEADGMYRNPETGDIYKVQIAHHGSGKLYAKILVKLDEPEIKRGKEAHYEFVMARGAIMTLKPEWRLTREDAAEFGHLYGCCIRCGAVLTDEASIERGIGPDCAKKF